MKMNLASLLLVSVLALNFSAKAADLICEGMTVEDSKTLKLVFAITNANSTQMKLNISLTTSIRERNGATKTSKIALASVTNGANKIIYIPQNILDRSAASGIVQLPINAYNIPAMIPLPSELTMIGHVDCVVF